MAGWTESTFPSTCILGAPSNCLEIHYPAFLPFLCHIWLGAQQLSLTMSIVWLHPSSLKIQVCEPSANFTWNWCKGVEVGECRSLPGVEWWPHSKRISFNEDPDGALIATQHPVQWLHLMDNLCKQNTNKKSLSHPTRVLDFCKTKQLFWSWWV